MSIKNTLDWYSSLDDDITYKVESNKNGFAVLLNTLMMEQGVSKSVLAHKLEKSAPYVTKVLRGDANLTIKSMTELLDVLDCKLHIYGCHKDRDARWVTLVTGGRQTAVINKEDQKCASAWARQGVRDEAA